MDPRELAQFLSPNNLIKESPSYAPNAVSAIPPIGYNLYQPGAMGSARLAQFSEGNGAGNSNLTTDGFLPANLGTQIPEMEQRNVNLNSAIDTLKLNEQEQNYYKRHLYNLYSPGGVEHPPSERFSQGARSTLLSAPVGFDDRYTLIPGVWGGQILSLQDSINNAKKEGLDKFPAYNNLEEAEARYNTLHHYMEKDTKRYYDQKFIPFLPGTSESTKQTPSSLSKLLLQAMSPR